MKKQFKVYMESKEYERLKGKAIEHFQGKGFVSKFLRKIANAKAILILEGRGSIKLEIVS